MCESEKIFKIHSHIYSSICYFNKYLAILNTCVIVTILDMAIPQGMR